MAAPAPAMRDSRASLVVATGLAGLAVGAGLCYCAYRAASSRRGRRGGGAAAKSGGLEEASGAGPASSCGGRRPQGGPSGGGLLQQVSGISLLPRSGHTESGSGQQGMDLPNDLEACHLQKLIHLLESTEDPIIQEQALITLSNSAAFSRNHDIIRNMGGLSVTGKMLLVPITKVKEKAMNALNNLSMNIKNQEKLKVYITKVCEEIDSTPLNSEMQLAGLRFLTNMSVTNNYQYMMASSIPCFLHLLSEGNERTQIQVLKVLVNLSANPAMTEHLLNAQAPFLLTLFDSCINNEVLLRVLVFVTNLSKHMKKDKSTAILHQYNEDSIFSVLWGNSTQCAQKLASLLYHPDAEIKEHVAKLIMQQC